jgi:serine/threonine-protein kinase
MLEPVSGPTRTSFGRYEIVHELATGGMGKVYLGRMRAARGVSLNVAIKRINPALANDPRVMGMFIDEARISAAIRHPNVVQTLDVVEESGELLLVMEYVHGVSLAHLLTAARKRGEPLPLGVVTRIASDALHGLHAAHEMADAQGKSLEIVHRDVSPQNILVGVDGVTRVADFGIARATTRVEFTQIGEVKGKLKYIAPEQFEREQVDRRADIYGTGLVLWEMIVGRGMRRASAPGGLAGAIMVPRVDAPSTFVENLPPVLDELVVRALANDPRDRFAFADQMAIALEEAVTPSPHAKVAELVRDLCQSEIAEHKAIVDKANAMEPPASMPGMSTSTPSLPPGPQSAASLQSPSTPQAPIEPTGRWDRGRITMAVAVSAGVFAVVLAIGLRHGPAPDAAAAPPPPPSVEVATATPSAIPTPPATATEAPTDTAPPPPAHAGKSRKPFAPHHAKGRPGKPDCTIPYVIDAKGIRVPRPECL